MTAQKTKTLLTKHKKMKRVFIISVLAIVASLCFSSCTIQQKMHMKQFTSIKIKDKPKEHFNNLDHGTEITVMPTQPQKDHNGYTYHMSGKDFYTEPTIKYVRSMGFIEKSSSSDFELTIKIIRADANGYWGFSNVNLEVNLNDENGNEVFSQNNISGKGRSLITTKHFGLDKAYTKALKNVDWNRIASLLKDSEQSQAEQIKNNEKIDNALVVKPKETQSAKLNETQLEQINILWDIKSKPDDADVFWRVVSEIPEVQNSSNKYLSATPYETSKTLNIKGLTFQNAENVSIIIRCEKEGYISQEKEFDIPTILEQEEISTFFRLVKE